MEKYEGYVVKGTVDDNEYYVNRNGYPSNTLQGAHIHNEKGMAGITIATREAEFKRAGIESDEKIVRVNVVVEEID